MKTIFNLAWSNTKFHRGKNILSGIAIILTTVLVYLVLSIGIGALNVQKYAVNELYPTFHAMYRNVSETTKDQLVLHDQIETYGLRQDVAEVDLGANQILMTFFDTEVLSLSKTTFLEGHAPESRQEIATSKAALADLGYPDATLGETISFDYQPYEKDGLGYAQTGEFQLVGILPDGTSDTQSSGQLFSMLVAQDFMEEIVPSNQRAYRLLVRLNSADSASTDELEEAIETIGNNFGINESDIVVNSDYLFANYVDPSFLTGVAAIIVIILIAGALTIYSIYYVSLINKVQEFGKLRALGATKKQVRRTVLLENLFVAALAIPIGVFISLISVKFIFQKMLSNISFETVLLPVMREAILQGKVRLFIPWILLLTIAISLITVVLSSLKPMRYASKIMPVEAMRYSGESGNRKKNRKGFLHLNLRRLTEANLMRNRKRTLMTIFSLSLIGILFVIVSTVISCMEPTQIARNEIAEDFRLTIQSVSGDKMHPEQEWSAIQQNNPLTSEAITTLESLDGVVSVTPHQAMKFTMPTVLDHYDDLPFGGFISGFDEAQFQQIAKYISAGSITYEEFLKGDKIIATGYVIRNVPEITVGQQYQFDFLSGEETISKTLTVAALAEVPNAYDVNSNFLMSNQSLAALSPYNLTYYLDIEAAPEKKASVTEQLEAFVASHEHLAVDSYDQFLKERQATNVLIGGGAYGIMVVLAIVGIMNLINTTIDSILSRKKELGVMQALGMSNRQMRRLLQGEGLFYAGGIIFISLTVGSLAGYGFFLYAKANAILQITVYHYPFTQVILLVTIILLVQLCLTIATTRLVTKETIISRIRNAG
ncbi:ABC transporter permease [Enterococcus sp. HY326]|uniref:ABC transporter permease n=1 Tax=Enterococcus sp. HY326 TaxID=2971265 RepID=UPI00223F364B|nr:ABC transporter permease [Enterococcus sp. HY326]